MGVATTLVNAWPVRIYPYRSRQPSFHHSTKSDEDWLTLDCRPRLRATSAVGVASPDLAEATCPAPLHSVGLLQPDAPAYSAWPALAPRRTSEPPGQPSAHRAAPLLSGGQRWPERAPDSACHRAARSVSQFILDRPPLSPQIAGFARRSSICISRQSNPAPIWQLATPDCHFKVGSPPVNVRHVERGP